MHPSIFDTSIIDLLEADPRPSFIVALDPHPPTVVYTNPAVATCPVLLDLIDLITAKGEDSAPLWEWITGAETGTPSGPSFSYSSVHWTRSVVHEQMVVVGANEQIPSSQAPPAVRPDTAHPPLSILSPSKRLTPVEPDTSAVAAEQPASSVAVPEPESRPKSTPATLPINPKDRPPSRAEAVQSLGPPISDPRWILPDTSPGQFPPCTRQNHPTIDTDLLNRTTPIPQRHPQRELGGDPARAHARMAPEA